MNIVFKFVSTPLRTVTLSQVWMRDNNLQHGTARRAIIPHLVFMRIIKEVDTTFGPSTWLQATNSERGTVSARHTQA